MLRGQIKKTRQHTKRFGRAGGDKLRERQQLQPRLVGVQRHVGQHAVGRAEIEADDVFGGHDSVLVRFTSPLPLGEGPGVRAAAAW